MNKGIFLKRIVLHNMIAADMILAVYLGISIHLHKMPNIKYILLFYGGNGIITAGIKVSKIVNDRKKKGETKNEE